MAKVNASLEEAAKAQPETKTQAKADSKEKTYVCEVKCFFDGQLFNVGDTLKTSKTVPAHFKKLN